VLSKIRGCHVDGVFLLGAHAVVEESAAGEGVTTADGS
jgi:hypothetical protein